MVQILGIGIIFGAAKQYKHSFAYIHILYLFRGLFEYSNIKCLILKKKLNLFNTRNTSISINDLVGNNLSTCPDDHALLLSSLNVVFIFE